MSLVTCLKALGAGVVLAGLAIPQAVNPPIGIFDSRSDVGITPKAGNVEFDAASGEYKVTGGGANLWAAQDAFQFAWKRVTGDVTLSADVRLVGAGVNAHRKAVLMIRQDLTEGSVYADIAVHGDGLTSLQYRPTAGAATQQITSTTTHPTRVRIERRGNKITVFAGKAGEELVASGPQEIAFTDPVYVGLGMCSHDVAVLETAVFSNVKLEAAAARPPAPRPRYRSKITIYDVAAKTNTVIHQADDVVEAPNWSRDGKFLLVNTGGSLYRLPVNATPATKLDKIDLGDGGYRTNNDHDFSPDGKLIGFSASSTASRQSQVFVANADGTGTKLLTPTAPSYFHGWSPDGKWLAFVGQRNGKYELFRVSVNGGPEERLTSKGAYDDGPEYTPDGKWIYFNSDRSGGWDLWRMPAEGGGPNDAKAEQVTSDEWEDWFPHISPNGRQTVFLAFPKGTKTHNDKMPGVILRLMPTPGNRLSPAKPETLVTFYGGQGTINVNSWSPDSKKFAYVVYEPLAAQ